MRLFLSLSIHSKLIKPSKVPWELNSVTVKEVFTIAIDFACQALQQELPFLRES